ncbi:14761_t:CDS:2, partial [Acaulospora colombiana]
SDLLDYENFGTIFLLLISVVDRYEFHKNLKDVLRDEKGFCHTWILQSSVSCEPEMLDVEKHTTVEHWVDEILTYKNISDQTIRETNPRILIELAPTIFKKMLKTTRNDSSVETLPILEAFLNPHTSYALIGVIQWLCDDIYFKGQNSPSSKVLKYLMAHENFPPQIMRLVGARVLSIFDRLTGSLPSVEENEFLVRINITALALQTSKYSVLH